MRVRAFPRAWPRPRPPRGLTVTPGGRALLLGSAVVYAAGVALGYPELLTVALGGWCLLALSAATALVPARVVVERDVQPSRVTAGDAVLGRVTVHNRSRWPSPPVVAVDRVADRQLPVHVGSIPGHGTKVVRYPIPAPRRGRWPLGPVVAERRDQLGLLRRGQRHGDTELLWVRPRVHRAVPLPVGTLLDYAGTTTPAAPRGAVSFASLREYVPGDDPRQVHWKSTARTGTLMVREHVDTSQPTVTVALDNRAGLWDTGGAEPGELFEDGAEVAASLMVAVRRGGRPVELLVGGPASQAADPLDRLAAAEPTAGRDPAALQLMIERAVPGGVLVVVTAAAATGITTALAARRRRFAQLVVIQLGGTRTSTATLGGLVILQAATATGAVSAWNRLVLGARS